MKKLFLKCDSGADYSIKYKKAYQELTKDLSHKHLTPGDGPINGYGVELKTLN